MAQALHLDQYSLTMGQFFHEQGMNDRVSFELFVRRLPKTRGYLIAAGLGTALWHLRNFQFTREDIDFLASQRTPLEHSHFPSGGRLYSDEYLSFLRELDFTCDVWAIPEGTPIGAQVPILRVTGPRIQATIIESLLLSIINHQTMIASKASRIVQAARGREVWDFSLRRLHGPEASLGVARAAYIAGCAGTATVEAGRILKIPVTGTMAHAQIMAYGEDHEQEVFEKVLKMYPTNHALLVDTYDTPRGVERAIAASAATNIPLRAIRIDSNLEETGWEAHMLLLGASLGVTNFDNTKIVASNDLDEFAITALQDTPVDSYGVGTMLGTSADAPHLGGVYKLVEQSQRDPRYVMKLTRGKQTDPGSHQVWRTYDQENCMVRDLLTLSSQGEAGSLSLRADESGGVSPLLKQVMREGRIVRPQPSLEDSRCWCAESLGRTPSEILRLEQPADWPLERSEMLWSLRRSLGDEDAKEMLQNG